MNPIQLIWIALRGLSVITSNPALGGGSMVKVQEASKLLDFLSELLERGDEAYTELKEFAETVKAIADENRSPTAIEWQTLEERSAAAHDVIQAARHAAEAEEAANQPEPEPEPGPEGEGGGTEPEPEPDTTPKPEPEPEPEPELELAPGDDPDDVVPADGQVL